jgi:hypothetical protein
VAPAYTSKAYTGPTSYYAQSAAKPAASFGTVTKGNLVYHVYPDGRQVNMGRK